MAELKPCPFCGGDAKLKEFCMRIRMFKQKKYYYAECSLCGVRTSAKSDAEESIEAWNRRTKDGK